MREKKNRGGFVAGVRGFVAGVRLSGMGLSVYRLEHFSIHFWWLWKKRKNYGKLGFKPSFKQLKRVGGPDPPASHPPHVRLCE